MLQLDPEVKKSLPLIVYYRSNIITLTMAISAPFFIHLNGIYMFPAFYALPSVNLSMDFFSCFWLTNYLVHAELV